MVHVCVVPGSSNRSDRETHLSFHCLPLKNKPLLKKWIHKIGRKNLPFNGASCVCSVHFINAIGRRLRPDEYPTINVPILTTPVRKRKSPTQRAYTDEPHCVDSNTEVGPSCGSLDDVSTQQAMTATVAVQTTDTLSDYTKLQVENAELSGKLASSQFRLSSILHNNQKLQFYTGFPNSATLTAFYEFLGPAVNNLNYWGSNTGCHTEKNQGRNRALPPMELFLVLVRLRLGLFEKDLADRFGISTSTVSRICITWINFLY